jgi:hypothetical protein
VLGTWEETPNVRVRYRMFLTVWFGAWRHLRITEFIAILEEILLTPAGLLFATGWSRSRVSCSEGWVLGLGCRYTLDLDSLLPTIVVSTLVWGFEGPDSSLRCYKTLFVGILLDNLSWFVDPTTTAMRCISAEVSSSTFSEGAVSCTFYFIV